MIPVALAIAGSDSSGGAGIQADLKTFHTLGVHGATVVTAVTAQDSTAVLEIHPVPAGVVRSQLDAVLGDFTPSGVKIGMLGTGEIVRVVAEGVRGLRNIVVDPVLRATGGRELLSPDAVSVLRSELLPSAWVLTPNLPEAAVLAGIDVTDPTDMEQAALRLHEMGAAHVLVTGGHLRGGEEIVDVFYDGRSFERFRKPRLGESPHGTGCVLSSAVAAGLARGRSVRTSIVDAMDFTARAIRGAFRSGRFPVCRPGGPKMD